MAKLVSVATAYPEVVLSPEQVRAELQKLLGGPSDMLSLLLGMVDSSGVKNRFLVRPLEQVLRDRPLEQKTDDFTKGSISLGLAAAQKALERAKLTPKDIDLIVTVSCTGFMIPSLDAFLMNQMGFRSSCRRLPITELGCAGGAAALSMANDLLKGFGGKNALIVAVELPSLTFQLADLTLPAMISALLFGDGAAAVVLSSEESREGAEIVDTQSHLFPNSTRAMGFDLKNSGFHIVLRKDVPELIRQGLPVLAGEMLARQNLGLKDLNFYALHPGGRKILEHAEEILGVEREALSSSWQILSEVGNLSSASVLAVYEREIIQHHPKHNDYGLMAAFGPGFSAELLLLRWSAGLPA
jgi:alkylresorcinol/alkylpyrone synthase